MSSVTLPEGPVYLTRKEQFSAAHRLHSNALSDEENKRIFDKCNHINGHGHNYTMFVTVNGRPDPKTGMIINLVDLKEIIHAVVLEKVDHKNLNMDVDEFKIINPTVENMVLVFWNWLVLALPEGCLHELTLYETENNFATFRANAGA